MVWNFETFAIYLMLEMPECVCNVLLFYDMACIFHGLLCSKLSNFLSDIFLVSCSVGKTYIPYACFFPRCLRNFGVAHKFSHLLQVHKFILYNPQDFLST